MASYNELNALIDAYINRNGVQAITGQILNGVLKAMVEQLGRGYTIMGAATPTTDPGTPDGPECYFASETGTYTDFDGLQVAPGELALLCYTPSDGWTKATIYEGFREVGATIDGNVGTPSVGVSYANGVLSFDFHNMKGNPGQNGQDGAAAGFGTIGADITGGVGTPAVSVESSGPATAKNLQFHFTNLKGETGVTSVVATVDNTTGTPACTVSLVGQQLTLAFTGLKGAQGDTGSSVDYPFTIVNNLTTDDATQALSAAQGVVLDGKVTQLEAKVTDLDQYTFGIDKSKASMGWISSNGNWGNINANYLFVPIKVSAGQTVTMKAPNSGRYLAFLRSYPVVTDGATADFSTASGYTAKITSNNTEQVLTVPSDVEYLVVWVVVSGNDEKGTVRIDGKNVEESIFEVIGETEQNLRNELGVTPTIESFTITSGGVTLSLEKSFVGGSTIYFKIVSNGALKTGTSYTTRFLNGNTLISSLPILPDVEYKLTLPANCNKMAVYVGSTQMQAAGTAYIEVSDFGLYYSNKKISELEGRVGIVPVSDIFGGGSLVGPEDWIDGMTLSGSGVETSSATSSVTGFIPVTASSYVAIAREQNAASISWPFLNEYDSNKSFIQRSSDLSNVLSRQLSATTAYIRLAGATSNKEKFLLFNSQSPFNFEIRKNGEYVSAVSENGKRVSELSLNEGRTNLITWDNLLYGIGINQDTHTLVRYENSRMSVKIPVIPMARYEVNKSLAIFNAKDEYIGDYAREGGGSFYAPANASYVRATARYDALSDAYMYLSKEIPLESPSYSVPDPVAGIPSNKLNLPFIRDYSNYDKANGLFFGKNLAVDGDSITHDQGQYNYWQFVLRNNLGMNILQSTFEYNGTTYAIGSKGIAGSRIAVGVENNTKPYCLVLRYQDLPADADLIVIAGGTNDWAHDGVELGTMADNTNVTFYGALHILCQGLIEKYPSKQIVFMTPIKRNNLGRVNNFGNTLEDFANAIIKVCGYYGIPVCDMFHNCTMNPSIPAQQTLYFQDDTHPNPLGQRRMGNLVTGFIGTLV